MGTNYYAFGPHKGKKADRVGLHIGKKSAGWKFLFRAHPNLQLTSLEQWVGYLSRPDVEVSDEYGAEIDLTEMVTTMTEKEGPDGTPLRGHSEYQDGKDRYAHNGFDFSTQDFF
ncbi:MAG: hypothetical protein IJI97_06610 [Clostridia bacterium]|nr:hypothetical protein [Clostridia bacterium]